MACVAFGSACERMAMRDHLEQLITEGTQLGKAFDKGCRTTPATH
ncbi:hypothetical protein STXM2123_5968 [Streptomyces sp. F-3]|nr:hypothetical protein STXM2123_5968 [Streptomyces sp. F-3]